MATTPLQNSIKPIGENSQGPEIIAASPRKNKAEKTSPSVFDMVMQNVKSMKTTGKAEECEESKDGQRRVEDLVADFKEFMEDHPQLDLINGLFQWLSARMENMDDLPQELQKTLSELTAMLEGLLENVALIDNDVLVSVENEIMELLSGTGEKDLADGRIFQVLKDKLAPIIRCVSNPTVSPSPKADDSGQNSQTDPTEKFVQRNAASQATTEGSGKTEQKTGSTAFVSRVSGDASEKTGAGTLPGSQNDANTSPDKNSESASTKIPLKAVSEKTESIESELKVSVKTPEAAETRLEKVIKTVVSNKDSATDARTIQDVKGSETIAKPESPVPTVMKTEAAAATASTASRIVENAENIENIRKIVQDFNITRFRNFETVRISLEPPELGKMQIKLVMNGSDLNAVIQTESAEARELLSRNLNSLRQVLADKGISIENFDISSEADDSFSEQPGTQEAFAEASRSNTSLRGAGGKTSTVSEQADSQTETKRTLSSGKIDLVA